MQVRGEFADRVVAGLRGDVSSPFVAFRCDLGCRQWAAAELLLTAPAIDGRCQSGDDGIDPVGGTDSQ